jgi:hypothetical protein
MRVHFYDTEPSLLFAVYLVAVPEVSYVPVVVQFLCHVLCCA